MINYCRDCGWLPTGGQCPFFKKEVSYDQIACPQFTHQVIYCSICGNPIPSAAIIDTEGERNYYTCSSCISTLGTCATCRHSTSCLFQTDTSCQEPQIVNQVVQQGNMRIQRQVRNPKRVEATCTKCPCYSPTLGCNKADGNCCELYSTNRKEK